MHGKELYVGKRLFFDKPCIEKGFYVGNLRRLSSCMYVLLLAGWGVGCMHDVFPINEPKPQFFVQLRLYVCTLYLDYGFFKGGFV